jgi:tetratricopeptide (TPR) repeat protein
VSADIAYHEYVTRDRAMVAAAYEAALRIDPSDFRRWHNLSLAYQDLRRAEAQVSASRQALRLCDSAFSVVWLGLLQGLVTAGRFDEAREALAAARLRFPDDRYLDWTEAYIAQNTGDYRRLASIGRALTTVPGHEAQGHRILADLAQLEGSAAEARTHRDAAIAAALAASNQADAVEDMARLAALVRPAGEARAQRAFLTALGARGVLKASAGSSPPYEPLEVAMLHLGLRRAAEELVAEARTRGVEPSRYVEQLLRVDEARGRGDLAALMAALDSAVTLGECPICLLPALARAQARAGLTDSAAQTYRRYLATPYIHRLAVDAEYLVPVLRELAELYEQQDQAEQATALRQRAAALQPQRTDNAVGPLSPR